MQLRAVRLGIALRIGVIALVLACAACGSTVPPSARGSLAQGGSELGLGPPGAQGSSAQSPGAFVPGVPGSGGGSLPGGGPLPSGPGLPGVKVPGVTADAIYIGAAFQQDQGTANAGIFGAGNLNNGDTRNYFNAVVAEINAAGGVAGRKIIPVFAEVKATSTQTIDDQYSAACEKWIRDSRYGVFAIAESGRGVVRECARKAGIATFGEESGSLPSTFQQYPNYVEISGINSVRQGHVTVDGLASEGYFTAGAKIGLITWDDSFHHSAVNDGYIPALRKHGFFLATEPRYARVPESAGDISRASSDISAAVLAFNARDIKRVLLVDGQAGVCAPGCLSTIFMREAQGQQYNPYYGMNSDNEPVAGYEGKLYPASQLRGAVAVIWRAQEDAAYEGINGGNPARNRCIALMKKHGYTFSSDNPNARAAAIAACGSLFFMQAAVARMPGPLSVANFMAGVNSLGYGYNDPYTFGTYFSHARHDGLAAVRRARFDSAKPGFRYTTLPYRV